MIFPANLLGDFAAERTVLLGFVPEYANEAEQARGAHLLVGEDVSLTVTDGWLMQFGRISGGRFQSLGAGITLSGALNSNVARRLEFAEPVLLEKGDLFAVRMTPQGQPEPLAGASVAVEWGVHATRRSTRA